MIKIECYVCREEAILREAKQAGWTTVVSGSDVRHYCTKNACREAGEVRRAEFPQGEGPKSFGDLSPEQLSKALKPPRPPGDGA